MGWIQKISNCHLLLANWGLTGLLCNLILLENVILNRIDWQFIYPNILSITPVKHGRHVAHCDCHSRVNIYQELALKVRSRYCYLGYNRLMLLCSYGRYRGSCCIKVYSITLTCPCQLKIKLFQIKFFATIPILILYYMLSFDFSDVWM